MDAKVLLLCDVVCMLGDLIFLFNGALFKIMLNKLLILLCWVSVRQLEYKSWNDVLVVKRSAVSLSIERQLYLHFNALDYFK